MMYCSRRSPGYPCRDGGNVVRCPRKIGDAASIPAQPLQQPCILFIVVDRRSAQQPDGVDHRIGAPSQSQDLGVPVHAAVVAAIAEDDQRTLLTMSEVEMLQAFRDAVVERGAALSANGGQRGREPIDVAGKGLSG